MPTRQLDRSPTVGLRGSRPTGRDLRRSPHAGAPYARYTGVDRRRRNATKVGEMLEENKRLIEKDRRYIWHAMSGYSPDASTMIVEEGDGAWITDTEGNRYLDGMSGLWCVNAGYGREELARAAYEQLQKLPFYPMTRSHRPAIELGERLNDWLEGDYVYFYSNSGSEANEVAFKITRQYHEQNGEPQRWKFVSRYRAYHGQTMGALAATGQAQRKYRYEPLPPGFLHVPPPDLYRRPSGVDPETYGRECARQIEDLIRWELPETVAGVIMEPIITGGGDNRPARELHARRQGGLRTPRGAAHRGRGDLRLRKDRQEVRPPALRRYARHRDDGEGHHQRLLPAVGDRGAARGLREVRGGD